jgi:diguanylate cyclase (GGDEF)-like protein
LLLYFVLCLATAFFAYLLYLRNHELNELRKYIANVENDLLQKQIKMEESSKYNQMSQTLPRNILDSVTGLPSYDIFIDRAQQIIYHTKRFGKSAGIVFLEMHAFASILDDLGADKNDLVLNTIAERLSGSIRQIDTVSRYKDDSFIFLLPELVQPEAAAHVAQRILAKFKTPFMIDNIPIHVNANIGIAVFPADGDNVDALIGHAQAALEEAKSSTHNQYYFYSTDIQQVVERQSLISSSLLNLNITDNISSYCLPQMNVTTHQIESIKFLAYINFQDLGLLKQEDYQVIAEREHKMIGILEWLMLNAIAQYAEWKKQGLASIRLAFDVTTQQIQHEDFQQCVLNVLAKTNFDPSLLAFEMAADSFADNADSLQHSCITLKNMGVKLSVGVFALGHLAIQKITQLPLNYLKLDKRVIKNLSLHSENENILVALHELSESMGLEMVVEGVDDVKQKETLEKLGFHIMQGKLFGEPQATELFVI